MKRLSAATLFLACAVPGLVAMAPGAWAQNAEPEPVATPAPPAPAVAPANPDCAAKASERKLAGAALDSFMKKCARDAATASCDVAAGEKKLKGAAKKSFTKKCVKDAIITQ